jgi:hypothetical protein
MSFPPYKKDRSLRSGLDPFVGLCIKPFKLWHDDFPQTPANATAIITDSRTIVCIVHVPTQSVDGDLPV